jgi:hypothetical protein
MAHFAPGPELVKISDDPDPSEGGPPRVGQKTLLAELGDMRNSTFSRRAGRAPALTLCRVVRAAVLVLASGAGAAAGSEKIHESFDSSSFDPLLFRASENNSGGRWEVSAGTLRAILPPGRSGRPPLKFLGFFHLQGNFKVAFSYSIAKLPRPKKGRNNIEVYLSRPGGFVSFFRNAESNDGYGYHVHDPKTIGEKDIYRRTKAGGTSGRIEIKRVGTDLHFSRGPTDGPLTEMGSVLFDNEPITQVAFQALAFKSTDGIDVAFDERVGEPSRWTTLRALRVLRWHEPTRPPQ